MIYIIIIIIIIIICQEPQQRTRTRNQQFTSSFICHQLLVQLLQPECANSHCCLVQTAVTTRTTCQCIYDDAAIFAMSSKHSQSLSVSAAATVHQFRCDNGETSDVIKISAANEDNYENKDRRSASLPPESPAVGPSGPRLSLIHIWRCRRRG